MGWPMFISIHSPPAVPATASSWSSRSIATTNLRQTPEKTTVPQHKRSKKEKDNSRAKRKRSKAPAGAAEAAHFSDKCALPQISLAVSFRPSPSDTAQRESEGEWKEPENAGVVLFFNYS